MNRAFENYLFSPILSLPDEAKFHLVTQAAYCQQTRFRRSIKPVPPISESQELGFARFL